MDEIHLANAIDLKPEKCDIIRLAEEEVIYCGSGVHQAERTRH